MNSHRETAPGVGPRVGQGAGQGGASRPGGEADWAAPVASVWDEAEAGDLDWLAPVWEEGGVWRGRSWRDLSGRDWSLGV